MSFILSSLGLAGIGYLLYKFTRKGTTHDSPLFRDPFLKPADFATDAILGEAPGTDVPLPAYQVPAPMPTLNEPDDIVPSVHTKHD